MERVEEGVLLGSRRLGVNLALTPCSCLGEVCTKLDPETDLSDAFGRREFFLLASLTATRNCSFGTRYSYASSKIP